MDLSEPVSDFRADQGKQLFRLLVERQVLTKEEAEAAVYALLDIAGSVEKVYGELLPKIMSNPDAPIEELKDLIWYIREEFRHIDYHIRDGRILDL